MITEIEIGLSVAGISRGITAEVEYDYYKKIKGIREGGVVVEPAETARVEVGDVTIIDFIFSDSQLKAIGEEILEKEHGN